jgi:hypothetical protein
MASRTRQQQRWPASAGVAAGAGLALLAATPAWLGAMEPEQVGRWESLLGRCQIQTPQPEQSGCLRLRLDQSIEGLLRVRFINTGRGNRLAGNEVMFAGLLLQNHEPMRCREGSCTPQWPMRLQVHTVSTTRFDQRGLAQQLPSAKVARGECLLEARQVVCSAKGLQGEHWQARASHRSPS